MTSLMGIIGKRLVSVLSLVVTIVTFSAAQSLRQMWGTNLQLITEGQRHQERAPN